MFLGPVLLGGFVVYPVLLVFNSVFVEVLDEGVSVNAFLFVGFVSFPPCGVGRKLDEGLVDDGWKKYLQSFLFVFWEIDFGFS